MFRRVPSIRLKMMLIVLTTCFAALLIAAVVLMAYDVRSNRSSWTRDLIVQAEMVGRASAPAIVFGDTLTAHQSLVLLGVRPEILCAAVYTVDGRPFARYARTLPDAVFPPPRLHNGFRFDGNRLDVFKNIDDPDGRVGQVFLSARYDAMARLTRYLPVLALVTILSLLVALVMTVQLQSSVTRPVLAIAEAADEVRASGDFSLRVEKTTADETGKLVDAFNAMLAEVAEAERSLLESNQRKDQFLATLAHELRNPLAPIRNATQYLRMSTTDPEAQPSLELIDRQVQHMVRLIEDLLDISRITRDTLELRFSDFTVGVFVGDVLDATQFSAEEGGIELRRECDAGDVLLHADRARLVQIVCNLVNNAIKFTSSGGRITLTVTTRRRNLLITVSDTGIGIPPERLRDIFEPFSQLDHSLEKTRGGLGIGLALSQRLVTLHHGTIEAHSEGPGEGSTFHVTLPIVAEAASRAVEPIASPRVAAPAQRILVADDNVDGVESLALLLRLQGHEVAVAHDGAEALECFDRAPFDAAIIDIGMPRINGYDVARAVRERGLSVLLIALTGWGQSEDKQRAYDAGFDSHLTKPVHPDQLVQALSVLSREARKA